MKFGKLEINPSKSPGVLDTATCDAAAAWKAISAIGEQWSAAKSAATSRKPLPAMGAIRLSASACVATGGGAVMLATMPDGQRTLVSIGADAAALGEPIGRMRTGADEVVAYAATAAAIDLFCSQFKPINAPLPLGPTPRMGIGVRMTTAVWPGIFSAMHDRRFAANSIQNSVRELNLLENLLACRPAPKNYACGFGTIETGYTGSTFEGLWLSGVLAALEYDRPLRYGADADHVQVKRADEGLAWAKRVLDAARYYTFYTMDVSDVLDYRALGDAAWAGKQLADGMSAAERRDLIAYHSQPFALGGQDRTPSAEAITRCAAKHFRAFNAVSELSQHLAKLKDGRPFDLEMSIDEHPPEVPAWECLTTEEELLFVLREGQRRGLRLTHVAPNFGVEKGHDYRHPSGLDALRQRVEAQHRICEEFGAMIDFHSADDLGSGARKAFRDATGGRLHYKVSPMLQIIFARTLADHHPELFRRWWQDARDYARREADAGSPFAAECLAIDRKKNAPPSPADQAFHHYSFAFVGRRDARGQFINRQEFYELSAGFYRDYQERIASWLSRLCDELFV